MDVGSAGGEGAGRFGACAVAGVSAAWSDEYFEGLLDGKASPFGVASASTEACGAAVVGDDATGAEANADEGVMYVLRSVRDLRISAKVPFGLGAAIPWSVSDTESTLAELVPSVEP